jgi:hypothetical protein
LMTYVPSPDLRRTRLHYSAPACTGATGPQ